MRSKKAGPPAIFDKNIFFRKAIFHLFSSLDIEIALERFVNFISEHIPADGALLGVYDPDTNVGKVLAAVYPKDRKKPSKVISVPHQLWDWSRQHWEAAPTIEYVNDITSEPVENQKLFSMIWPGNGSHLRMDLELENHRLGVLLLFTRAKHQYSKSHISLISIFHDSLSSATSNVLKHQEIMRLRDLLEDDNRYLNQRLLEISGDTIIGEDFGLSGVMEMVRQVAAKNSPVLLLGETGVGKEVIANAIHNSSQRKDGPLIRINCGAIPDGLIDSELFGHEKGAFTGAVSMKRGLFERGHKGTVFLDEIAELPLSAQVRLLRVLQEKEIQRVGGDSPILVDVRIVSATHRDLETMVKTGRFREDLWFRLNVFPIMIPPLRKRPEDIPALVNHLLEKKSKELKIQPLPVLSQQTVSRLMTYEWPGNVRELENYIERLLITGSDSTLDAISPPLDNKSMPASNRSQEKDISLFKTSRLNDTIKQHIEKTLAHAKGKIKGRSGAAVMLDVHPSTLRAKMRKLGIPFGKSAPPP